MTDREEIAAELLIRKVISNLLQAADKDLRQRALEHFKKVGTREIGEIDGNELGSVQLTKARESWVVDDMDAFLTWVKKNHPDEVITETREVVRSSFQAALIAKAKAGEVVEQETGEIVIPPGLVPKVGKPILTVTPNGESPQAVLQALGDAAVILGLAVRAEIEA